MCVRARPAASSRDRGGHTVLVGQLLLPLRIFYDLAETVYVMGSELSSLKPGEDNSTTGPGRAPRATLTVYFEGTANRIDYNVTQIGLFADITDALDLQLCGKSTSETHQYKLSFDGCGVTNGSMGVVFATGLVEQCTEVCKAIDSMLATAYDAVTLNVVGLSRGGIAAIYLAQMVGHYSSGVLTVNLLLFDPVPGNLITTSRFLDLLGYSTANASMDLSKCSNLGDILALYPYLPLPDLAFHAPVFPIFPPSAQVSMDAVLGCHQGALFCQKNRDALLSFVRIKRWLIKCGTLVTNNRLADRLDRTIVECKSYMDKELYSSQEQAERHAHSYPAGVVIVRHKAGSSLYLNKWHKEVTAELVTTGEAIIPEAIPAAEDGSTHLYLLEIVYPS